MALPGGTNTSCAKHALAQSHVTHLSFHSSLHTNDQRKTAQEKCCKGVQEGMREYAGLKAKRGGECGDI